METSTRDWMPSPEVLRQASPESQTRILFDAVANEARRRAMDTSRRGWAAAIYRIAEQLAAGSAESDLDLHVAGARFEQLAEVFAQMWLHELRLDAQLAVLVQHWWIQPNPVAIAHVVRACQMATIPFEDDADAEHSRLLTGRVQPAGEGSWAAHIGTGEAATQVGTFPRPIEAYNAAVEAILERRARLRTLMTDGPGPLQHLVDITWQQLTVTEPDDAPSEQLVVAVDDLVSPEQIAERLRVETGTVYAWIKRHRDFPAVLGATRARDWQQVQRWYHQRPTRTRRVAISTTGEPR